MEKELLKIENNIVVGCDESVENVVVPQGITEIGCGAFANCKNLKSVILPDSVKKIGISSFFKCEALENIDFGSGVEIIDLNAFEKCFNLQEIKLPESVVEIKDCAFKGCMTLTNILIGKNVQNLASNAFHKCYNIENFKVDKENIKYDSRENCNCIINTAENKIIAICKNSVIPAGVESFDEMFNIFDIKQIVSCELNMYAKNLDITDKLKIRFHQIKNAFLHQNDGKTNAIKHFLGELKNVDILLSNEEQYEQFEGIKVGDYLLKRLKDKFFEEENIYFSDREFSKQRLNPKSQLILGKYNHETKSITLYIKSILKTAQKNNIDFIDYVLAVWAHEYFHAYHALCYDKNFENEGSRWLRDSREHSVIVESMASYAEFLFIKDCLENEDLLKYKINIWKKYSLLAYSYSGVRAIICEESKKNIHYVAISRLRHILKQHKTTRNLSSELTSVYFNRNYETSCFRNLFELSMFSLFSAERKLLEIALDRNLLL